MTPEPINQILNSAYSISIYPPGTHHKHGYNRTTYLAVVAGPHSGPPGQTFCSYNHEADNPTDAIMGVWIKLRDAT